MGIDTNKAYIIFKPICATHWCCPLKTRVDQLQRLNVNSIEIKTKKQEKKEVCDSFQITKQSKNKILDDRNRYFTIR